MPGTFWTTLIATLSGGLVSILTAWLTAEYSLRRYRAEVEQQARLEEAKFKREASRQEQQRKIEPLLRDIVELQAFSEAAGKFLLVLEQISRGSMSEPEQAERLNAKIEYARHSVVAFRYAHLTPIFENFDNRQDFASLADLVRAIDDVVRDKRIDIDEITSGSQ